MQKMVKKGKTPQRATHKKRSGLNFDGESWTSPVTKSPIKKFNGSVRRQEKKNPNVVEISSRYIFDHEACVQCLLFGNVY